MAAAFVASPEFQANHGALDDAGFVATLYQTTLGRAPDAVGLQAWVDALQGGRLSRAEVLVGFSESAECMERSRADFADGVWTVDPLAVDVVRLYGTVLHRLPDASGLSHWTEARASGFSIPEIARAFVGSTEFHGRFGALGDRDFVDQLYRTVLDRPADQAGLDGWTAALDSHALDRADVALGFAFSAEMTQRILPLVADGILLG